MRNRVNVTPKTERRTIGYVRVSTDDQAENGVSLASQEERLRAWAIATDRSLDEIVVDAGVSAKTLDRPGLQRILTGVREGSVGAIVTVKLDRLTRSVRDLADLVELTARCDVALVSVSEALDTASAAGRMVTNMLGVVAQWERETISERTVDALGVKRRKRAVYGRTPFGFRREGSTLVEDPREQAALREMHRMDREGESYRAIGAWLTAEGILPHSGAAWHASSVRAVLRSRIASEAA
jgi:site-specific DNA recombinase